MNKIKATYTRADIYDLDYTGRTEDIAFITSLAQELIGSATSSAKILEFCCGTGRITIPLARAGFNVMGVDITPEMLTLARKKLKKEPADVSQRVQLLKNDMRCVQINPGSYNLVLIPFNSFLHMTTQEDQLAALANAYDHVVPGGYFLADIFMPEINHLARYVGPRFLKQNEPILNEDTGTCLIHSAATTYNPATQVISEDWYYKLYDIPTGQLKEDLWFPFEIRIVFPAEWDLLLARVGFKVVARYGDYAKNPFGPKARQMLFVCQKPCSTKR